MSTNATVRKIDKAESDLKIPVNSIQSAAYVKRIAVHRPVGLNEIYHYDLDNLYPQKILTIRDRSWSLSSATKTYSDFITGDGWSDENLNEIELNSDKLTGYDLLRYISDQKAVLGFALHFNYNIKGKIVEINTIDFETLRKKVDGKIVYNHDWSYPYMNETVEYYPFAPENAVNEIREVGIENYTGQVLYWTGTNKIYPLASFDAALDAGQYQAETELFKLRNVQNDFSASGAFRYPKNIENSNEWDNIKAKIKGEGVGANNAGKVVLVGVTPDTNVSGKMWETFERNNVDKLFETQNKEAQQTIFSVLRQPQILGGVKPDGGWPNQQELEDAFVYYNSIVEQDRKEVEKTMAKVFEYSIWDFPEIMILPKMLIKNEGDGEEETQTETEVENGTE